MKRILSILLALVFCLSLLPAALPVHAKDPSAMQGSQGSLEIQSGCYLKYTVSGEQVTITDCDTSICGNLVIPDTIGGYPVTGIGEAAFSDCSNLFSVTVPESVTTIGVSAFYSCDNLCSVTLPESVAVIGDNAFANSWPNHVYYQGVKEQWNSVDIGIENNGLRFAALHCESTGQEMTYTSNCTRYEYTCTICDTLEHKNISSASHSPNEEGLCLVCGEQLRKIYFDASGSDWTSIRCYSYEAGGSMSRSPGAEMTAEGDSLYSLWIPQNISSLQFNRIGANGYADAWCYPDFPAEDKDLFIYQFEIWTANNGCAHSFEAQTISATCVTGGGIQYTCKLCNETAFKVDEPLGHRYVAEKLSDPTCTEPGSVTSVCSVCGHVRNWEYPAPGHNYVHTLTAAPTCSQPAQVTHTCDVCGDSYTDNTLAPLDQSFNDHGYLWAVDAMGQDPSHIVHCMLNYLAGQWNHKCTEDDVYGCYRCTMTIPGDDFESFADSYSSLSVILDQLRNVYGIDYDEQNHTYTIGELGGYGGFTNDRLYVGFVNNGSSYDVYYEELEKEPLSDEGYNYLYSLGEWPSSIEYNGNVYYDFGCGEYARVISYSNSGNKYTVELYENQLRIVSMTTYTPEDKPAVFSDSLLWEGDAPEHSYVDGYCQNCGAGAAAATVSVDVTSFGSETDPVILQLFPEGQTTATYIAEVTGNTASFTFENIVPGNYVLKVSKNGHVAQSYALTVTAEGENALQAKITVPGDINCDGRLNIGDVVKLYAYTKGAAQFTDSYQLLCADFNGDGRINVGDVVKVYALLKTQ